MTKSTSRRAELRRTTFEYKDDLLDLADKLETVDREAANAVKEARSALFVAWTYLSTPPEDDDDHDH